MEWIVTGLSFYYDFLVLQWFRADPRVRPTPLGGPLQAISDGQAKVRPTSVWGGSSETIKMSISLTRVAEWAE